MIHDPLAVFTADFGVPIVLHLQSGDRQILAIYDDAYIDQALGETVMDARQKRFTAAEKDICGLKREDRITYIDKQYTVINIQPDGTGMALIHISDE